MTSGNAFVPLGHPFSSGLCDIGAVNETLAEMNAEPVVDTRRHITTDVGRDTWQDTSEVAR